MPEIGDITPPAPPWGRRPTDRVGSDPRRPKETPKDKPRPRDDDDKDDSRGGQIDEYA
jgi:hypothetical protein